LKKNKKVNLNLFYFLFFIKEKIKWSKKEKCMLCTLKIKILVFFFFSFFTLQIKIKLSKDEYFVIKLILKRKEKRKDFGFVNDFYEKVKFHFYKNKFSFLFLNKIEKIFEKMKKIFPE